MSAIGPGDWVVCVDASAPAWWSAAGEQRAYLVQGKPYCVLEARGPEPHSVGMVAGFVLDAPEASFVCEGLPGAWPVPRFRPIPRSSEITALLEKLKTGAPSELEPVEARR